MRYFKIYLILIVLLFFNPGKGFSGEDLKYSAFLIPEELKKDADYVVRQSDITFKIINKGHALYKKHFVITILNKNADMEAAFEQNYSKLLKIKDYNMSIYDGSGKLFKKVSKSDFKDEGAVSNMHLYSDDRVIKYEPSMSKYPYTVEYNIEEDDYLLMVYPSWVSQNNWKEAVENSTFKFIVPTGFAFQKKERNLKDSLVITNKKKEVEYLWKASNLLANEYEPYSNGIMEIVPNVILAPYQFEIAGYEGNLDSWKSFGQFIFNLNSSKNILSEKTVNEIKDIVKTTSDQKEQVKLLYQYMQNKTRYINIKIGIGGWKPFDASIVDKLGYGDCKALSNYMKTILDAAGINSFYTLIYAGENVRDIATTFPRNYFNHAILCVPFSNDTLWLECTSQKIPFGYLGGFTSNRHALVITPNGGLLLETPKLNVNDNLQIRTAEVNLDSSGGGTILSKTKYTGVQFDERERFYFANADDQKKLLYQNLDLTDIKIDNMNYEMDKGEHPSISESLNLSIKNYATLTGKRMFLNLNLLNKATRLPSAVKERKTSMNLNWAFNDIDTVIYHIPDGMKVEYLPESKELKSDFGYYKTEIKIEGKKITYIRTFIQNRGNFHANRYKDFIDFRKQILNFDGVKVSLIKSDG